MSFHVIIPARYHSSRLPGKPLANIGDKPMILHVCEQAKKSGAKSISVATDNSEIMSVVNKAGFSGIMTSEDHESGSDRVYEATQILKLSKQDIVVNVQGDEPFIPPENISQVASILATRNANMATLCCRIIDPREANNPNVVKVIFDKHGKAIYFSRSVIPFNRDNDLDSAESLTPYYRHIGLYAYTTEMLSQFVKWPISSLESIEKLEQLRVIENGESIYINVLERVPTPGIDTPDDLENANRYYQSL